MSERCVLRRGATTSTISFATFQAEGKINTLLQLTSLISQRLFFVSLFIPPTVHLHKLRSPSVLASRVHIEAMALLYELVNATPDSIVRNITSVTSLIGQLSHANETTCRTAVVLTCQEKGGD